MDTEHRQRQETRIGSAAPPTSSGVKSELQWERVQQSRKEGKRDNKEHG